VPAVLERTGLSLHGEPLLVVRDARAVRRGPGPRAAPIEIAGYLTRWGSWHRIEDPHEARMLGLGRGQRSFVESVARGAMARTFAEHAGGARRAKLLFQHGLHGSGDVGKKPLGAITDLGEDASGPFFRATLFSDAAYVSDLTPAILGGQLQPSYAFTPVRGELRRRARESEHNPEGLPEVTVIEARVKEISLVVHPADPTASVRVVNHAVAQAA